MTIRPIVTEDAERFLNMLKQLDHETNNMMYEPDERKTTADEMKAKIEGIYKTKSLLLIAEEDNHMVGFLSAERGFANRIKHSAYIVIGILRSYRKKGIGEQLFDKMEEWAAESGIARLELTVMTHNEGAVHLYKKMGFKIEGVKEKSLIVDGNYIDEYYMGKIL